MADETTATLIPIEERTVNFYGDEISAALVQIEDDNPQVYVPLRPISDYLGLAWSGQYERLKRDPVLSTEIKYVRVTRTKSERGNPNLICLPLEYLPGWLFGINADRVRPELRDKIIRYQRECFRVLWEAFQTRAALAKAGTLDPANPQILELTKQIDELTSVTSFLREHLEMMMETTGQVSIISDRLDQAVQVLEALTGQQQQLADEQAQLAHRQEETEITVNLIDERTHQLTPAHRRAVKDMVDTMARQTKNRPMPLEHYMIYGRLKSRFHVATYSDIADEQFDQVIAYLREELRRATNGELPEQQSLF